MAYLTFAKVRTASTSSARIGSMADTGTATTALDSPRALKTSTSAPSSPPYRRSWKARRTRRPGPGSPDWLEGFDDAVEAARDAFATRMALHPDDQEGQRIQDLGFRVGPALGPEALDQELRLWTSTARSAPMRPTHRPPIRRP